MIRRSILKFTLFVWLLCLESSHQVTFQECPEGKSLFSKGDIEYLITNYVKQDKALAVVDEKIQKFMAYKDYVVNDLTSFCDQLHEKPEKLTQMLKDIASSAKIIEPLLKKIAVKLNDLPTYLNMYNNKVDKFKQLENDFRKYKKVCDAFCEEPTTISPTTIPDIFRRSAPEEAYYCSTFQELQAEIKQKINSFADTYAEALDNTYQNWTESVDIEAVKEFYKTKALEIFGKPMYDVLNIKRQYEHLIEFEKQLNFESAFHDLQENCLDVDKKLLQLESAIEKYGKKCKACSNSNILTRRIIELSTIGETFPATTDIPEENLSLLDKAVLSFTDEVKQNVGHTLGNQLEEVHNALKIKEEELLQKLQDAKLNVDQAIAAETKALEDIKKIVPVTALKEFLSVKNNMKCLQETIQHQVNFIEQLNQ